MTTTTNNNLLSDPGRFSAKVSSVLNRNVKEFGKKFLFDGREDTCWNSEQGSPQFVLVAFPEAVTARSLQLMFQGGFAGKECWLEAGEDEAGLERRADFHPDDANRLQTFELDAGVTGRVFRVVFGDSTDFFGRITLYQMNLLS